MIENNETPTAVAEQESESSGTHHARGRIGGRLGPLVAAVAAAILAVCGPAAKAGVEAENEFSEKEMTAVRAEIIRILGPHFIKGAQRGDYILKKEGLKKAGSDGGWVDLRGRQELEGVDQEDRVGRNRIRFMGETFGIQAVKVRGRIYYYLRGTEGGEEDTIAFAVASDKKDKGGESGAVAKLRRLVEEEKLIEKRAKALGVLSKGEEQECLASN
ncbi:MAG: hypothetical protein V1908_01775 [Candidatus Peregrinibacteria bacterium]